MLQEIHFNVDFAVYSLRLHFSDIMTPQFGSDALNGVAKIPEDEVIT